MTMGCLCLPQEFYQVISLAEAVVPAFAGDAYYRSTASSSVAAAFLCDTPLLADQRLLRHYSYLTAVRWQSCTASRKHAAPFRVSQHKQR